MFPLSPLKIVKFSDSLTVISAGAFYANLALPTLNLTLALII